MLGSILGMALMAGGAADLDPASLVEGLGSSRYRERESAEAALTRLGREALSSLRAAVGAKDPEVRIRAAAILGRIEGTLLVEPTSIAFDFRRATVAEAIRTINDRSGLDLRLQPDAGGGGDEPSLTLRTARPLPFWEGLDALCEAGGLHYTLGARPKGRPVASRPSRSIEGPRPHPARCPTAARSGPTSPASITRARSSYHGPAHRRARERIGRPWSRIRRRIRRPRPASSTCNS